MFLFLEFDPIVVPSPLVDAFVEDGRTAVFKNVSSWTTFILPLEDIVGTTYVLSNLRKSPYDLAIIQSLVDACIPYVVIEAHVSFCAIETGACFQDPSVINCCQIQRIEYYRSFYAHALLTVFNSTALFEKNFYMLGMAVCRYSLETETSKVCSDILKHIQPPLVTAAVVADKRLRVFVHKSSGGLGDFFLALPSMLALDAYYDDVQFGFPPVLAAVFQEGSALRRVVSYTGDIGRHSFYKIIDLDNYPPKVPGENKISFPTLNKVFQHASFHYYHAVSRLFTVNPDVLFSLPFLSFESNDAGVKYITVHPGSRTLEKCWPTGLFEAFVLAFSERYPSYICCILYRNGDPVLFNNDIHRIPENVKFVINNSILDVAKIIGSASLRVGNDSGLTHLAGVLNTPVVALFGPTPPQVWGPLSTRKKILTNRTSCKKACSNEIMKTCEDRICINQLPVSAVLRAVEELLLSVP